MHYCAALYLAPSVVPRKGNKALPERERKNYLKIKLCLVTAVSRL